MIFGGMLQMPAELWPADRDAFETYWRDGLAAGPDRRSVGVRTCSG